MNVFPKIKTYSIEEVLVILILISLPLGFVVNSISIILLFVGSFLLKFIKIEKNEFNIIIILLIMFYVLSFSSLLWTDSITNTKIGLSRFLSFLIIPLAFAVRSNKKLQKEKVIKIFSKSLVFYASYCLIRGLINTFRTKDVSYLFYHKLSGNLSNMNAIYLSVFISFAITYYLNKKIKSKLDIFSILFLSLFLILLSSKIVITITIMSSIFILSKNFRLKKVSLSHKRFAGIILLLFFLASLNFYDRVEEEFYKTKVSEVLTKKEFGHIYLWTGTGLRMFQIRAFTEILLEKKKYFLGLGLNNSQKSLNDKYNEYDLYPGFQNYNFHNQYIQIQAELGFTGLLLVVSILIIMLKQAISFKDYFLLSFIFLIVFVFMTESFIWRQRGMVFFITILLLFNRKNNEVFK
jgi:hypothetical protein